MRIAISHHLPGRIRLEIADMRHQPLVAYQLQTLLETVSGVHKVNCNESTGRALIYLDERTISVQQVVQILERHLAKRTQTQSTDAMVASTSEWEVQAVDSTSPPVSETVSESARPTGKGLLGSASTGVSSIKQAVQNTFAPTTSNPYRLPAIASAGMLGVLAVKRLFFGRSLLATAPTPFYLTAGVSIVAGYPVLRRGLEKAVDNKRVNPDLLLGLFTMGLAVMRENLVALSAITMLNIAMYRRHKVIRAEEATHLPPELERHSRQMTRAGALLSPLTWLLTGSPLRALGVLLAANPRPATLAHKYAWARAEEEAVYKRLPLPKCGTLEALAASKTIVFAEGVSLNEDSQEWSIQMLQEEVEESKAVAIAASLLQKETDHPLQKPLLEALEKEPRTLRTPFHVERSEDDSVQGQLNGHDVILCTKEYAKKNGLDLTNALLQERRMRRDGYKPFLLVQDGELLALLGCKQQLASTWCERIETWQNQGFDVRYLQRDEHVPCPIEMMTVHELCVTLEQKQPVLVLGGDTLPPNLQDHPHLIHLQASDASRLDELFHYCSDVQARVSQDIGVVKAWNRLGPGLAIFAPLTAPLINLMCDTLGVFLIARQNWQTKRQQKMVTTTGASRSAPGLFVGQESVNQNTYYAMQSAEVLHLVGGRLNGLTQSEVLTRQKKFGANLLQAPEPPKPLRIFLGQFKEFSTMILIGASLLSLFIGEYFNAVCMGGILVVNAAIGTYQEMRSTSVLQALKSEENTQAKVVRDDQECMVPISQLVPGDMVLLEAGDLVPADMRILEAWNLEVNESMLTGESLPASKSEKPLALDTPLAERHNLLYMGTTVTRGRARAVVVATGSATQIGALQSLLSEKGEEMTPLQKRVSEFSKRMVIGSLIAGGVVAVVGFMRGIPPLELLISSITLAASAIPEGLPLTITIALTAGVMRMVKKKAIVRKLGSLESLGRVTVICSDKTGTLTRNEMTVKELATLSRRVRVTGDGYGPEGEFLPFEDEEPLLNKEDEQDLQQMLTIGLLCNNASVEQDGNLYKAMGDPTESALITVAMKAGLTKGDWKRHREIPFDSFTGSMSVVCEETANSKNCLLLCKGSPEAILQKCTHYQSKGEIHPISELVRQQIEAENRRMAEQALRVLGFGYRKIGDDETPQDARDEGLVYVGLMGMIDPPKEDVAKSIAEARTLGIKPVMITGDHPITARAIGQQLGIYCEGDRILTGNDLEEMSAEQLVAVVPTTSIFARVSPEHKLRIVEAYQKNGEVVAMTGDGVNDAPAVRKADVGIAMGVKGTDITKDTAGIVLTEDHFHSIVDGIKEGRMIIGNIRKAIGCLLTGNLAEVLVTATAVVAGLPMPLIPLQILLMNLLTDALPAMVLATDANRTDSEQRHKDVVDRSLYRTVLTRGAVLGVGALATFAIGLAVGLPLPVAQTMTFATLVAGQLIQTVSWRNHESNRNVKLRDDRTLLAAMSISWLALIAAIYMPALQGIFFTTPLTLPHWAIVLGVSGFVTTLSGQILHRNRKQQLTQQQGSMKPLLAA